MRTTGHVMSATMRAQYAELLNLAATIDEHANQLHGSVRSELSFLTLYVLFDAIPALEEDYSDLLPNPPADPTAWRGAQFRAWKNAATA